MGGGREVRGYLHRLLTKTLNKLLTNMVRTFLESEDPLLVLTTSKSWLTFNTWLRLGEQSGSLTLEYTAKTTVNWKLADMFCAYIGENSPDHRMQQTASIIEKGN